MNRIRSLRAPRALSLLAAGLVAAGAAQASDPIVGVWWSTVSRIDCATGATLLTFTGMQTYHHGGTMSDTNSQNPAGRGPGMGTWKRKGHEVVATFRYMGFNGPTWLGTAVVNRTMVLSADGRSGTATSSTALYDPSGALVATGCARDEAVRID